MKVYTEVLGNINRDQQWKEKLKNMETDYIFLDQWTAQKSRFLGKGTSGEEYPIALKRHTQVADGDVIDFDPDTKKAVVLKIELRPWRACGQGSRNHNPAFGRAWSRHRQPALACRCKRHKSICSAYCR